MSRREHAHRDACSECGTESANVIPLGDGARRYCPAHADAEYRAALARAEEAEEEAADLAQQLSETIDDLHKPGRLLTKVELAVARAIKAERERDEARTYVAAMVEKAAAKSLDGYRELGQRAAEAENDRDTWRSRALAAEGRVGVLEAALRLADGALAYINEVCPVCQDEPPHGPGCEAAEAQAAITAALAPTPAPCTGTGGKTKTVPLAPLLHRALVERGHLLPETEADIAAAEAREEADPTPLPARLSEPLDFSRVDRCTGTCAHPDGTGCAHEDGTGCAEAQGVKVTGVDLAAPGTRDRTAHTLTCMECGRVTRGRFEHLQRVRCVGCNRVLIVMSGNPPPEMVPTPPPGAGETPEGPSAFRRTDCTHAAGRRNVCTAGFVSCADDCAGFAADAGESAEIQALREEHIRGDAEARAVPGPPLPPFCPHHRRRFYGDDRTLVHTCRESQMCPLCPQKPGDAGDSADTTAPARPATCDGCATRDTCTRLERGGVLDGGGMGCPDHATTTPTGTEA